MAGKGDPAAGRRDNRRGHAREREYAGWLRDLGLYPLARAARQFPGEPKLGDLTGVGPRAVEITVDRWEMTPAKLRQAKAAADRLGHAEYMLWRHIAKGTEETGATGDSVVIVRAAVLWPLLAELDEYRALYPRVPVPDMRAAR